MTLQAIKTGPAMKRHLEAHGIQATIIERRRDTKLFHVEVTRDTGVDPAVEFAKRIRNVPGVEIVNIYPDVHAYWREDNAVITASLDLAVVSKRIPLKPVVCDVSPETNLPEPAKRFTEGIKYPLALPKCMAIVLYQAA